MIRHIRIGDADYPPSLSDLARDDRPEHFSVEGDFSTAPLRVAIVGARAALPCVAEYVKRLAAMITSAGGVVISGGALGVDTAAHVGAIEARGRTWSVIGCGAPHVTPDANKELFAEILARGGAIIRTRDDGLRFRNQHLGRNRILVALAQVLVVAQAAKTGGTMNSASWGQKLNRPMWVVPSAPWLDEKRFEGTWRLIKSRAPNIRPLHSESEFLKEALGRRPKSPPKGLTDDERRIFEVLGSSAKHPDEIALETGLPTPAVTTALLTLALGDVVVEGSAGLFQRKAPP